MATVLVIREGYAAGWSARVNGTESTVWRANGRHMAVHVPAGASLVSLRYATPHLRSACLLMGFSMIAAIVLWTRCR